ncbi:YdeI/OmpD-associated family protein [Maribellus sp. YY47]|uniref:YdeI/OmpD-associated family protein n=1 Tax=Maribellus sp. YY47 TaxID=2929486 RepID=UPI002000E68E|nr:YdeI/OmpD-associated family protein [Maribellus sp. YY47]MCK3684092.1 YdeI/OmpD-associated family protein [Maribellus sp. YY47]
MEKLRAIVLDCGLTEELKWRQPCYTLNESNVVIISGFKEYCLLGFFKGVLLKDPHQLLTRPGDHTQAGRQIRFNSIREIEEKESIVKAYIYEAIQVEKSGLRVKLKKTTDYQIPEELQSKLDEMPEFKAAFEALTPGRQRAYILHFSKPKQSKTREARVEKLIPQILEGKGLNDL